jgi:hypothetical protein
MDILLIVLLVKFKPTQKNWQKHPFGPHFQPLVIILRTPSVGSLPPDYHHPLWWQEKSGKKVIHPLFTRK